MVRVQYEYPHSGEIVKIAFKVDKFEQGWRITDIIYEGGISLQKILRNPI
jgi:ABC-type transporter MlaC component